MIFFFCNYESGIVYHLIFYSFNLFYVYINLYIFYTIIHIFLSFSKNSDSVKFMRDLSLKYGPVTRTWIVHKLAFIIRKPELLETILTSTKYITKSSLYDFLDLWLGDGLLLSTGSKWHSRRKIITPAFHFKILEDFVEIFDRQSKILAKKLVKHADGKEFNIYPYVTLAALDVVCGMCSFIFWFFFCKFG